MIIFNTDSLSTSDLKLFLKYAFKSKQHVKPFEFWIYYVIIDICHKRHNVRKNIHKAKCFPVSHLSILKASSISNDNLHIQSRKLYFFLNQLRFNHANILYQNIKMLSNNSYL